MRIVQFEHPSSGPRLGVRIDDIVHDLTSAHAKITRVTDAFAAAQESGESLQHYLDRLVGAAQGEAAQLEASQLLQNRRLAEGLTLRPPVDHADHHRVLVAGTGLTHLGSMQSRDEMHAQAAAAESAGAEDEDGKSDSKKMFEMGLRGGRPEPGSRGDAPEWFYKGNGAVLRGPYDSLELPEFALDGGEEPEIAGCYIVDGDGRPRRVGFALGNEWSDHATEKINYLYLAPSKLRACAIGPELILDDDFQSIELRCTVTRDGESIYDSGTLVSGEQHMCHSLANCEDHHFKYPQHRVPGDVHVHFFGTSKLSYGERDWAYQAGDEIRIEAPQFSSPLVNSVVGGRAAEQRPVVVQGA